ERAGRGLPDAPDVPSPPAAAEEARSGLNVDCDIDDLNNVSLPGWLGRRLTPERLEEVCERVTADDGRVFLRQLLDNIPAALFILLPLMALVLKILYPMSKRYYAEHLLFVLHYHAFFFLILTVEILFSRLAGLLRLPTFVAGIAGFAVGV